MAATRGADPSQSPLVVLLLGEKLSGKSSVGNTILGKKVFREKTTRSTIETGTVFGKQVMVVDTPGWMSCSITPGRVSQELRRGLTLCRQGPHVILLVLSTTTTFSQEVWRAMEAQLRLIQIPIWQRAVIVFTHGDKLGGLSIEDHIRQQGRTLRWLLERCGNRYQVLTKWSQTSAAQVAELFEKINKIMEVNERPREERDRMYTQLRQEASVMEEKRWQQRQEEIEMTVMYYPHDRRQMFSQWTHVSRAAGLPAGPSAVKPALSLVLLGRRKSGKSSAGNMILDRDEFQTDKKTTICSTGHGEVLGRSVTVVDTPGWSLFYLADPEKVKREISRSPSLCPVSSKVTFLLAIPVDTFAEKDRRAVETYLSVLGDSVWRSTVVLFTYGDELREKTIQEHIKKKGKPLQWLLDRCDQRHHVFHTEGEDEDEVAQLLEMVERL